MQRILIVEDEPRIAAFIDRGLRARGYLTTVTDSGGEALRLAGSADIDLLVLDLGLPDGHGLSVLAELRQGGWTAPIVVVTASSDSVTRREALDAGADAFLPKPFPFAQLLQEVSRALTGAPAGP